MPGRVFEHHFVISCKCSVFFSIDINHLKNWLRNLTKLLKKNVVYQGHNLKQYRKSFRTFSNNFLHFLQQFYLPLEESHFRSEKCKFSLKIFSKNRKISIFSQIFASRISENGCKDDEKTFDLQTNKTDGYHWQKLHFPNLVKKHPKKMKTFFPRQKTTLFLHHFF